MIIINLILIIYVALVSHKKYHPLLYGRATKNFFLRLPLFNKVVLVGSLVEMKSGLVLSDFDCSQILPVPF